MEVAVSWVSKELPSSLENRAAVVFRAVFESLFDEGLEAATCGATYVELVNGNDGTHKAMKLHDGVEGYVVTRSSMGEHIVEFRLEMMAPLKNRFHVDHMRVGLEAVLFESVKTQYHNEVIAGRRLRQGGTSKGLKDLVSASDGQLTPMKWGSFERSEASHRRQMRRLYP